MFTREDSRVERQGSPATLRLAPTSGCEAFAKNRASNAQTVQTGGFSPLPKKLSAIIFPDTMIRAVNARSGFTLC